MTEQKKKMLASEFQKALAAPTPREAVQWKPVDVRFHDTDGGFSALALAYADARFVQNRLDEVVGTFNWKSDSKGEAGLLMVGIGILHPETNEWIWKWDTGQGEDERGGYGGGKGLVSTGFKRAAYQWGIGRDLYDYPTPRCRCKGWTVGTQGKKHLFRGWLESPWGKAEAPETGRHHKSQVETGDPTDEGEATVEYIPASSTSFYAIAYQKMKISTDEAKAALQPFIDKETGEIDYEKAILMLEKNLPADDRDFTKQQQALEKKESKDG